MDLYDDVNSIFTQPSKPSFRVENNSIKAVYLMYLFEGGTFKIKGNIIFSKDKRYYCWGRLHEKDKLSVDELIGEFRKRSGSLGGCNQCIIPQQILSALENRNENREIKNFEKAMREYRSCKSCVGLQTAKIMDDPYILGFHGVISFKEDINIERSEPHFNTMLHDYLFEFIKGKYRGDVKIIWSKFNAKKKEGIEGYEGDYDVLFVLKNEDIFIIHIENKFGKDIDPTQISEQHLYLKEISERFGWNAKVKSIVFSPLIDFHTTDPDILVCGSQFKVDDEEQFKEKDVISKIDSHLKNLKEKLVNILSESSFSLSSMGIPLL